MTENIDFVRGNDRIKHLIERPDLAEAVARTRQTMKEADRAHAMDLAALRIAQHLPRT